MGTSQSTSTNQTPNEPVEGYSPDAYNYPLLSTPTDQPYEPNQGFVHDPVSAVSTTPSDQTSSGPLLQDYSKDLFNPPLGQMSDQNRKKCCSCVTFESIEAEYTNLGDGRYLCPDCLPISLMEPRQLEPIIRQVHSFFKDYLKLPIKKKIPIFFMDQNEMRSYMNIRGIMYGMCIRARKHGKYTFKIVESCVRRGHDIEAVTMTKNVRASCKVGAIFLLFGLPKEVLGPTLAHEIVHALIMLQDWGFKLEKNVEESICEVVAYRWLKYTAGDFDPSYTEKDAETAERLRTYQKQIIINGSTGFSTADFLKAKYAIKKYGLKHTLKLIGRARNIPE